MATNTTNYALIKPAAEDFYDISVPNGNMDKIDTAIKAVSDAQAALVPKTRTVNGKALSADITLAPGDVGAIPDSWLDSINKSIDASRRNTINILRLKLQQSLAATDIDAWSDLLADSSEINSAASSNYVVSNGSLSVQKIEQTQTSSYGWTELGYSNSKVAQRFTTGGAFSPAEITVRLEKHDSPTGNVYMYLYATSGGLPTTPLYQATDHVNGSSFTGGEYSFHFSGAALEANTMYAIVLQYDGGISENHYFQVVGIGIAGGMYGYAGASWSSTGNTMYFSMQYNFATIAWKPVTATEALACMAVSSDQAENSGAVTWYLSDDGSTWVEADPDTIVDTNFDAASVYLKCVLTKNAVVYAVAYGGY